MILEEHINKNLKKCVYILIIMSFFEFNNLSSTYVCSVCNPLPYVGREYEKEPFHYYDEESSDARIKYITEVQNWLQQTDKYGISNRQRCSLFYRSLLDQIYKLNYNIKNINQFKEDIIHYLYSLSDLDHNGEPRRVRIK